MQMMLRVSAVCHMLDTCSHFSKFHSLVFNAVKTQLIRFARCDTKYEAKLSFFGQELDVLDFMFIYLLSIYQTFNITAHIIAVVVCVHI